MSMMRALAGAVVVFVFYASLIPHMDPSRIPSGFQE